MHPCQPLPGRNSFNMLRGENRDFETVPEASYPEALQRQPEGGNVDVDHVKHLQ